MAKIAGGEKAGRRTCRIDGRGDTEFVLVRKNTNKSTIHAVGANPDQTEEVDSNLIRDERIKPRPSRVTAKSTIKEYPADRPAHRVCSVSGADAEGTPRDGKRYHLLRKGADQSHILEIGQAGKGEWVPTPSITDEWLVPKQLKPRQGEARKPVRLAILKDEPDQEYLVLRDNEKGIRLVPVFGGNYGKLVTEDQILERKTLNAVKKKGKKGTTPLEDPDSNSVAGTASVGGESPPADGDTSGFPMSELAEPAAETVAPVVHPAPPVEQPAHVASPAHSGSHHHQPAAHQHPAAASAHQGQPAARPPAPVGQPGAAPRPGVPPVAATRPAPPPQQGQPPRQQPMPQGRPVAPATK